MFVGQKRLPTWVALDYIACMHVVTTVIYTFYQNFMIGESVNVYVCIRLFVKPIAQRRFKTWELFHVSNTYIYSLRLC